ncbi:MAG: AAA family ATPase [Chloroflexota bacterium]
MSYNIAVAGKGGSGKTSIASLIIRYLKKNSLTPILAVDADPNANLGDSLGLVPRGTVGSVLADFQKEKIKIPPGMTKEVYLDLKLNEIIVEAKDLDLVTMGRGEGRDCYCYPNTVLRNFIDRLAGSYAYLVMDNEAGMEHLSRATTQNVDELLIISDHSVKGVRTAARIRELALELGLIIKRMTFVINMVPGRLDQTIAEEMTRLGITQAITIPRDENVYQYDLKSRPLTELPDTSPAVKATGEFMTELLKKTASPSNR